MKTYFECIPCIFRQTIESSKLAVKNIKKQKLILADMLKIVKTLNYELPPPMVARELYTIIRKRVNNKDLYLNLKNKYNKIALSMYPKLNKIVFKSKNPLETAARLAIAGNIIDFGVTNSFNIDKAISNALNENLKVNDYKRFEKKLSRAKTVLYLADNAGEIVFDRILIETINKLYKPKVYVAVKSKPVINDALYKDAKYAGLCEISNVILSGCDAPGTIFSLSTKEFKKIFKNSDIIISKGQGNFETLHRSFNKDIFYFFKVKCDVVAKYLKADVSDTILKSER